MVGTVAFTVCVELIVVAIAPEAFVDVVEEGEIERDAEDCDVATEIEP